MNEDQARLFLTRGAWQVANAVVDPEYAISSLKSRGGGGSWPSGSHPELPYNQTATSPTGIYGYTDTTTREPVVSLSYSEIRRWSNNLPEQTKAQMRLTYRAMANENDAVNGWCYCPHKDTAPNGHSGPCRRHHPTDAERAEHCARKEALARREDYLARKALGLLDTTPKQLELFA
ncbi:hypothetical protein [Mycolicibacterium phocaicum]|uniref:hypothetical protein n=1 Tax=Mycolicibacterium phocaicum TaxID=319706 RepID=UPI001CFBE947|nr:hypothetical protein [Mycolicibacterium phocaicum]UCZ58680.1 hypothetical protein LHJ73_18060 [Mycolicibacterium phocaicum]